MQISRANEFSGIYFNSLEEAFNGLALYSWWRNSGLSIESPDLLITPESVAAYDDARLSTIKEKLIENGAYCQEFGDHIASFLSNLTLQIKPSKENGAILKITPDSTNSLDYEESIVRLLNRLHFDDDLFKGKPSRLFKDREYQRILHSTSIRAMAGPKEKLSLEKIIKKVTGIKEVMWQPNDDTGWTYVPLSFADPTSRNIELQTLPAVLYQVRLSVSLKDKSRDLSVYYHRGEISGFDYSYNALQRSGKEEMASELALLQKEYVGENAQRKQWLKGRYNIIKATMQHLELGKSAEELIEMIAENKLYSVKAIRIIEKRPSQIATLIFTHPQSFAHEFYDNSHYLKFARNQVYRGMQEQIKQSKLN